MSDKIVTLVGCSPRLIGKNLGGIIDNSDLVVRVNLFRIGGFESDVGTRTDMWFSNFTVKDCQCPDKSIPKESRLKLGWRISRVKEFGLSVDEHQKRLDFHKKFIDSSAKPTTGLLAILWLLEKYDHINIVGMGSSTASTTKDGYSYYWGSDGLMCSHDPTKEQDWFDHHPKITVLDR